MPLVCGDFTLVLPWVWAMDECLNETLFGTLGDAQYTLEEWQEDYNWRRSVKSPYNRAFPS